MALRNRVTPFGEIEALAGRGTLMGNRGVIHNERREVVRPWKVRRWIACVLEFRGRHRAVMTPNRWTELFFLDEASAFSAGHRPCAECRNADYKRFRSLWESLYGPASADDIDEALHAARVNGRAKRTYREDLHALPDGAFVALDGGAWLLWNGALHRWSDRGYDGHQRLPALRGMDVLTPEPLVEILRAGYIPSVHVSVR